MRRELIDRLMFMREFRRLDNQLRSEKNVRLCILYRSMEKKNELHKKLDIGVEGHEEILCSLCDPHVCLCDAEGCWVRLITCV